MANIKKPKNKVRGHIVNIRLNSDEMKSLRLFIKKHSKEFKNSSEVFRSAVMEKVDKGLTKASV